MMIDRLHETEHLFSFYMIHYILATTKISLPGLKKAVSDISELLLALSRPLCGLLAKNIALYLRLTTRLMLK